MSEALFIRHAETDMAGTFCGHSDPPVNARGQQQIQDLIRSIEPHSIACIYSSDLQRATATAQAIATSYSIPLLTSPRLREINFGAWEGLTWQQIEQRDAAYARRWTVEFPHLPAPGGETFADFQARILDELTQITSPPSGKHIAIVTHAGVLRLILSTAPGCTQVEAWNRTKAYCSTFMHTLPMRPQESLR